MRYIGDVLPLDVRERLRVLTIAEYSYATGFKSNLDPKEVKEAREYFAGDEGSQYVDILVTSGLLRLALEIRRERFAQGKECS